MIVADAWYTSITALTLYGAAAGILGTVAVVWATFRVANPHRRLLYGMPTATPLLNRQAGKFGGLVIRRDEQTLTNPYVVEIVVTSRTRTHSPTSTSAARAAEHQASCLWGGCSGGRLGRQ